jgi:hypothetical protein
MQIQTFSNLAVYSDRRCDYIPFIATISNIIDIVLKTLLSFYTPSPQWAYLYEHIREKSLYRCALLLIPGLNFVLYLYDIWEKKEALALVEKDGRALESLSYSLRDDKEVVLPAVSQNGLALQYTNFRLQADEEVTRAACQQNPAALEFASEAFRNNTAFMADIFEVHREKFDALCPFIGDHLKADPDFIKRLFAISPRILKVAHDDLRRNHPFMLDLIGRDYSAMKYVIGLDEDSNFLGALTKLCEERGRDERSALVMLKTDIGLKCFVDKRHYESPTFMIEALKLHPKEFRHEIPHAHRKSIPFLLEAMACDPLIFILASDEVKANEEFLLKALELKNVYAERHVRKKHGHNATLMAALTSKAS